MAQNRHKGARETYWIKRGSKKDKGMIENGKEIYQNEGEGAKGKGVRK